MEPTQSMTFFFDSNQAAAAGLLLVLIDARETDKFYRIQGLSVDAILSSGLLLEGQIESISAQLLELPGVVTA